MKCARKDCEEKAYNQLRIELWSKESIEPAEGSPSPQLCVCKEHGTQDEADKILDGLKSQIERTFEDIGLPIPDWDISKAYWVQVQ